jgi:hypothetical protein
MKSMRALLAWCIKDGATRAAQYEQVVILLVVGELLDELGLLFVAQIATIVAQKVRRWAKWHRHKATYQFMAFNVVF